MFGGGLPLNAIPGICTASKTKFCLITKPFAGICSIENQLAEKDTAVGVDRVHQQVPKLCDVSLEGTRFLCFFHRRQSWRACPLISRQKPTADLSTTLRSVLAQGAGGTFGGRMRQRGAVSRHHLIRERDSLITGMGLDWIFSSTRLQGTSTNPQNPQARAHP